MSSPLLPACTSQVTELSIDVVTDGRSIDVYAREVDRPTCTCNCGNFPAPGECAANEDGVVCTCDPGPAHCVSRVEAVRGGEVVESVSREDQGIWCGYLGLRADEVVDEIRIEGCGGTAEIALGYAYATPTITSLAESGLSSVQVQWTTAPPTPYALVSSRALSAVSCLDENEGDTTIDVDPYSSNRVAVRALDLDEQDTPLGTARVWFGNADERDWTAPE